MSKRNRQTLLVVARAVAVFLENDCFRLPKKNRSSPKDYDPYFQCKRLTWDQHLQSCCSIGNFEVYYHMSPADFDELYNLCGDRFETCPIKAKCATHMGPVEGRVKLACCLRILFGEKPKSLSQIFHVSIPSVKLAFVQGIEAIVSCKDLHFGGTPSHDTCNNLARGFRSRSNYPDVFAHCVSAVDGLAIRVTCPKNEPNQRAFYSGHKKFYCLNLQAACDSSCSFTHFALNCPGSANDLLAYKLSQMSVDFSALPKPFWVAGDNAYPDADHLITPFPCAAPTSKEDTFNFYLSQLRITIERAFGILVTVFGILQSPMKFNIPFTVQIVQACLRIHNFRIRQCCQPPRRSACINYDTNTDARDLLMNDARYQTEPVAATPRLVAIQVARQTADNGGSTLRREAMVCVLKEVGGERPVGNIARMARLAEIERRHADPTQQL